MPAGAVSNPEDVWEMTDRMLAAAKEEGQANAQAGEKGKLTTHIVANLD